MINGLFLKFSARVVTIISKWPHFALLAAADRCGQIAQIHLCRVWEISFFYSVGSLPWT